MNLVFIDIETIPTQDAAEVERIAADERARNAALVKPHSEAKVAENIDDLVRKTALDAASGEIICIAALSLCGEDITARRQEFVWHRDHTVAESERAMIAQFLEWLRLRRSVQLCGHNVVGFDVPFIRQRAHVHGLRVPPGALRNVKPWDALERDTMLRWSGGQPGKSISLDRLCRALGVPGKGELDGAGVWDAVRAGRIADVAAYCVDDVYRSYECWVRMDQSHPRLSAGIGLPGHGGVAHAVAPMRSDAVIAELDESEMGVMA